MKFDFSMLELLSSKFRIKVLEFLLAHDSLMSEREIAAILHISHMSINRTMKDLEKINLVHYISVGKAHLWKVNRKSYAYAVLSALLKVIDEMGDPLRDIKKTICKYLPTEKVQKVVLFGSVSKGEENESSDIDLFILVKNSEMKKEIEPFLEKLSIDCLDLYGNRLAPYVLTAQELNKKKDLGIIREIQKGIQVIP